MTLYQFKENAQVEGWDAFGRGLRRQSNPFIEGTTRYWYWDNGWECAADDWWGDGAP